LWWCGSYDIKFMLTEPVLYMRFVRDITGWVINDSGCTPMGLTPSILSRFCFLVAQNVRHVLLKVGLRA
jgi:hypothetical protein